MTRMENNKTINIAVIATVAILAIGSIATTVNAENPLKQSCDGLAAIIHSMLSQKLITSDQNFTYNKICYHITGPLAAQLNGTGITK